MKKVMAIGFPYLMIVGCASHMPMNGDELDMDEYCRQEAAWAQQTMNMDRDGFGTTLGSGGGSDYEDNISVSCKVR
ncbi:hypothetical protein A9Q99_14200 [Gammaproteobacteria bacterium 45_16_T64]|nr:hypothetical protein A9Q99_14200 [Gammaproteobacteria bacterium 45_16_T64]